MKSKYKLIIHAAVQDEVLDAVEYYQSKQKDLGLAFYNEWIQAIQNILMAPEGYQKQRKNFRQIMLDRFPYLIIFEVVDREIYVYRLINANQNPKKRHAKRK